MTIKQYDNEKSLSGFALRAGARCCKFCGNVASTGTPCNCTVKIKLQGREQSIDVLVGLLASQFEIIEKDDMAVNSRTYESYQWIAIRTPTVLALPTDSNQ